jgi:phosphotransferase system HPr-like phosphotransfer protein
MKSFKVTISSITEAKNFCNAASKFEKDIDLVSGRYVVDAKSLLGILSLDLSKEITCEMCTDSDADVAAFKKAIAEESQV